MSAKVKPFTVAEHLESAILELDEPLLLSSTPQFPWQEFAEHLSQHLELEDLTVETTALQPVNAEDLSKGLSQPLFQYSVVLGNFEGMALWMFPEEDASRLLTWVLTKQSDHTVFRDDDLLEAFARFTTLEALQAVEELEFAGGLTPRLTSEAFTTEPGPLSAEVHLNYQGQTCVGRLVFSHQLIQAWMQKFAGKKPKRLPRRLASKLSVTLSLEVARTSLELKEWEGVDVGDMVLLPTCRLKPTTFAGPVAITMNGRQILTGRIKKSGKVKILDAATYQQIEDSMVGETYDEDVKEDEDLDLSEDFDDEESFEEDESEELEEDLEEESLEEDDEDEEDEEDEEEHVEEAPQESMIGPGEIPLALIVEAGRLQMTADKLMELGPGSILDLQVTPQAGVSLVVNGKCVGRGELVQVGDHLGVRVLEKG